MTPLRTYEDACAAAIALDLIGERWSLLVVRELLLGPKRFTELRAGLPGVSANVLARRLVELEAGHVLERCKLGHGAKGYALTPRGRELEPILLDLARWAVRSPTLAPAGPLGADGFMISLRVRFVPALAGDQRLRVAFHLGEERFLAEVADGALCIERSEAVDVDATLTARPEDLRRLAYGGTAAASEITGDAEAFARLMALFPKPS